MWSSNKDDWTTPKDLFNRLNKIYDFGLDAAANAENHLCDKYYSLENNALEANWVDDAQGKWIWMNPPYGRQIKHFMLKAHQQVLLGAKVVALVPSRTDTIWWHHYAMPYKIDFIQGRLRFGGHSNPAPFPSALIIMEQQ